MPVEAFSFWNLREDKKILRYREVLKADGTLKNKDQLMMQGFDIDWWSHSQLILRYGKDKQQRFYVDNTPFDRILLDTKDKHNKALYIFY